MRTCELCRYTTAIVLRDNSWIDPDMDDSNGIEVREARDMLRLESQILLCQLHIRRCVEVKFSVVYGLDRVHFLFLTINFSMAHCTSADALEVSFCLRSASMHPHKQQVNPYGASSTQLRIPTWTWNLLILNANSN
jgi:hypothetical protein